MYIKVMKKFLLQPMNMWAQHASLSHLCKCEKKVAIYNVYGDV